MGKQIYWILLSIVSVAGITLMIYFGLQPRPVQKIKISRFETSTVVANAVSLRLYQELKGVQFVSLAFDPLDKDQSESVNILLGTLKDQKFGFSKVILDPQLQIGDSGSFEIVDVKENFELIVTRLQKAEIDSEKILFLVPVEYGAQSIKGSFSDFVNQNVKNQMLSISFVNFPRNRESESNLKFPCDVEGVDRTGIGKFGCLVLQSSRAVYRKRFAKNDLVGFLNQVGKNDYIMGLTREL